MATDGTVVEGVAGRYAAALFDLAKEASKLPAVEADLAKFGRMLDESPDLVRLVRSPVISAEDQAKALAALAARGRLDDLSANFLQLVARNRRLFLPLRHDQGIPRAGREVAWRDQREVTSAVALTGAQTAGLKQVLKASVGKEVTLTERVDPSLLGGISLSNSVAG